LKKRSIKNSLPSIIDNELKARNGERFSVHKKVFAEKINNILQAKFKIKAIKP